MAPNQTIDYDALAKKAGAVSSVDYDALAKQAGATASKPSTSAQTSAAISSNTGANADTSDSASVPIDPRAEFGQDVLKAGVGFAKGLGDTVSGVAHLIHKIPRVGETLSPAQGIAALDSMDKSNSTSESVGKGIESIAEFATGDEALEGLAKASKIVALADKYPQVARILSLAKEHPVIAKIIASTAKSAAVGGAQGGIKGSAEGNTVKGAEGGAAGGAIGGAVGEMAGAIAEPLAKKFGVGTTAIEDAKMDARPAKRNLRFAADFQRAAPYLDRENSANAAKTVEDWANHARNARENVFDNEVQPLIDRHANVPLGGLNIADGIRKQIPEAMKRYSAPEAAKMEQLANDFMPQQKFQLNVADAEDALEHFNAKLASTGYWSKMPSERAAIEKTDGTIAGYKAAADSIRDELYGKLDQLEPNSNMRGLKQDYGALRNVENEIRGRVNVNDRQAPLSLKETIGIITGLGHGGILGSAMAAIPILDRLGNSPENLIARGVNKAVGNPSAVQNIVGGAIKSAPDVGANLGSQIGQAVAEPTQPNPDEEEQEQ